LNSLSLTLLNSFYSVFIVLIIYSLQISIFMKQPWSTVTVFVAQKKLSVWGSNLQPWRYSMTLYHTETIPVQLVSEPDPRKNRKGGLGDRLGRKCTLCPECRLACDWFM